MEDQIQSNKPQQPLSAEDKLSIGLKASREKEKEETEEFQPSAEYLATFSVEDQDTIKGIYKEIDVTSKQAGARVRKDDPEWKYIQAELEDPYGSLSRTLIAAEMAAEAKAERLKKNPQSAVDKISTGLKNAKWTVPGKST